MTRISIGNVSLDILDLETAKQKIFKFLKDQKPTQIITLNSLMFNVARKDSYLADIINKSGLITADSSGIVFAAKYLTGNIIPRIPGIDLIEHICQISQDHNYKIFLLGSKQQIVEIAAHKLQKKYPKINISGFHKGYFSKDEEQKLLEKIKNLKPDILLVALSMPYQEKWIASNLNNLNIPIIMGVGGSFDVISDKLKRAPFWMRNVGLEWFFRLVQQPWRILKMKNLPLFIWDIYKIKRTIH